MAGSPIEAPLALEARGVGNIFNDADANGCSRYTKAEIWYDLFTPPAG